LRGEFEAMEPLLHVKEGNTWWYPSSPAEKASKIWPPRVLYSQAGWLGQPNSMFVG
jgi:hypothetical protein